jgi:hypothetical protein
MPGPLNHSPADVIRHLLVGLGYGRLPSGSGPWPISVGAEGASPDNFLTVYNTTARNLGRVMDGERQGLYGIQIRVRGVDEPTAYAKAQAIAVGLDGVAMRLVSLGGSEYVVWSVSRTTDPLALGYESPTSKRVLYTVNAVVSLRMSSD